MTTYKPGDRVRFRNNGYSGLDGGEMFTPGHMGTVVAAPRSPFVDRLGETLVLVKPDKDTGTLAGYQMFEDEIEKVNE